MHFHMVRCLHKDLDEVKAVCCVTVHSCILSAGKLIPSIVHVIVEVSQ